LKRIEASAPGKLVLLGEYAVLDGAPALVLAVDCRASAKLDSRESPNSLIARHPGIAKRYPGPSAFASRGVARKSLVPGFRQDDEQNQRFTGGDGSWEIVSPTLQLQARVRLQDGHATWIDAAPAELEWVATLLSRFPQIERLPACRIELDSDTFHHDHAGTRIKLGLGSSAALTVALLGALHALGGQPAPTLAECVDAHRAIQHGRGSGIDIAASLHGGLSRFQLDASHTPQVEALTWPDGLHWRCVYSGKPASTSAMLATVAAWRARQPGEYTRRIHELATMASRGVDAVARADSATALASFHDYAIALAGLGEASGADIASRAHRALGQLADECGVTYKSCGAGGGDVGITFSVDDVRLQVFSERATRAGFPVIEMQAAARGLEVLAVD
jgi:phosphomevalonate kinase